SVRALISDLSFFVKKNPPRFRQRLERYRKPSGETPRRFPVALKALSEPWRVFFNKKRQVGN
ncbi:hypothetical protein ACIL8I_26910, partial [Escherichia coli]